MPAPVLSIDFETRSACDIIAAGADVYAEHPSTQVLCMAWAIGDGPVHIWRPLCGDSDPIEALDHIAAGGMVAAWNSAFEESIWTHVIARDYGYWPQLRTEQLDDTMARAYAAALPGALGECAKALGLPQEKDDAGRRVMLQLSKPRIVDDNGNATWWAPADAPAKFEHLYKYCQQDVVVEREIGRRLRPLSAAERQRWLMDQRINRRGVLLDVAAIDHAKALARSEMKRLSAELRELTAGAVPAATNVGALVKWVQGRGYPDLKSLDKAGLRSLLQDAALPGDVRKALKLRQEAGKASTAKFTSMLSGVNVDGRARGLFQFHAATTGRWAGRRIQLQNLVRPKLSVIEAGEAIELFADEEHGADCLRLGYGAPLDVLSWCIRGMLIPAPGHEFIGGDFSNIEGRVLAWLAGEEWKLQAFRDFDAKIGPDLYKLAYARAFGVPSEEIGDDDDRRQIGKVMELACGYQGGIGAFRSMAKNYNADLASIAETVRSAAHPDAIERAEQKRQWLQVEHKQHADLPPEIYLGLRVLVDAWREAHPATKFLWKDVEECAMSAVQNPGTKYKTASGLLTFICGRHFLYTKLPGGRLLSYARPNLVYIDDELRGGKRLALQYWATGKDRKKTGKKKFEPAIAYGGLFSENDTQAVSCDVLSEAMLRMEAADYPIVLHVHDEARAEVPIGFGSAADCARIMSQLPEWAGGLPVAVKCEVMRRYHK